MGKSCVRCPKCRNSKGELVESKLFNDLLSYSSNDRTYAKKMYALSKSEKFLDTYKNRLKFDENGEVTMRSLLEVSKTPIEEQRLLNSLNNQVGAGTFEWNEAIQKVQGFNQYSQWKDQYIATLTQDGNKFKVSVQKRSTAEENNLHKLISNQSVQQRIISLLAQHGISTEFLTSGHSMYSTENAQRTANGLYNLVRIVQGKTDVTQEVAEEAGHVAIGALGDSPLVKRLLDLLTVDVQKQALGDEYDAKYLGRDARREVAGDLVGQALLKRMSNNTWGNLVNRIADLAKRVFYKIKADNVSVMRVDAERMADRIAKNFMSDNFQGNVETALATPETLYSAQYSTKVRVYKQMLVQMQSLANTLRASKSNWADTADVVLAKMQLGKSMNINQNVGAIADTFALEGIAEGVDMLVDIVSNSLPTLLNSVDFENTYDFTTNMARNGKALREAHLIVQTCANISRTLADNISRMSGGGIVTTMPISYTDSVSGERVTKDLIELQNILAKFTSDQITNGFYNQLVQKEKAFFIKFLEETYGGKYVQRAARVVFDRKLAKEQGHHFVAFRSADQVDFDALCTNLEQDISLFDRFLGSMADSGDIVGELIDKITKLANKEADNMTNNIWDDLRALRKEAEFARVKDPAIFYERDPKTGKLTGNIIDRLLWGVWENEYKEFVAEQKKKFLEEHANDPNYINRSELEKALMWQSYFEPIRVAWHKGTDGFVKHSDWKEGADGNPRWTPVESKYSNKEYDALARSNPNAIKILQEIMAIKETLDSMTDNGMPTHRAPQFKGTFINKVRNKGSMANIKSYGQVWWSNLKDGFTVDVEDAGMYGSDLTYNSPEEDMFANQIAYEKEKINRIPLFGINKLKDMDMLSTDIYSAMLSYAGVATHYAATKQIVDTAEIGREILRKRTVQGDKDETQRGKDTSRAFTRYGKYLDKQVYGVGTPPIIIGKWVVNKLTAGLTSLASKIYLGGNIPGGIVNLGTGKIEIFKEAVAGEYFDMKNLINAKRYYFKHGIKTLANIGKTFKDDELSLIIRHFNMLNNSRERIHNWSTYTSGTFRYIFGESLLLPYTAGDHYMQTIPYLALMDRQELLAEDGSKAGNLLQLYHRAAIKYTDTSGYESSSDSYGHNIEIGGPYFKTEEDRQEYLMLKSIVEAYDNAPAGFLGGKSVSLSQKQIDYVNSKGWRIADMESTRDLAEREMSQVQWNSDDESVLMDKAREIDDRLHGIYNELDKTAMHQNIYGAMLLGMRGYALGLFQRRYGRGKYSVVLGGETEGNILTATKMIAASFTDRWGFGKTIATLAWPWSKKTQAAMEAAGFSANQYRNIRRTHMDLLGILALALVKGLCAPDDDDKEKEREKYKEISQMLIEAGYTKEEAKAYIKQLKSQKSIDPKGVLYYFMCRWEREQAAYNTVKAMYDEMSNVTSLIPAGASVAYSLGEFAYLFGGAQLFDYEEHNAAYYKDLKEALDLSDEDIALLKARDKKAIGRQFYYQSEGPDGIYHKGDPKWERKFDMMMPYWNYYGRTKNVLYHPYQAAKSFEYGRKVRN